MLFHISEDPGIVNFQPRASESAGAPVVWTIDADRLRNYLVPRDCPRVTFAAGPAASAMDVARFLGESPAVVAIESGWFERLRSLRLYCYHLPHETFECSDQNAGYFVSREAVVPVHVEVLADPIAELLKRGVELRLLPSLWVLRDAVMRSSLQFSIIRMRNALPRMSER